MKDRSWLPHEKQSRERRAIKRVNVLSLPVSSLNNRYFDLFTACLLKHDVEVFGIREWLRRPRLFNILHIHFPIFFALRSRLITALLSGLCFIAMLSMLRLLGVKIVYTVHNVIPLPSEHHRTLLAQVFMDIVQRLCVGFVFLSKTSSVEFFDRFPYLESKPHVLIPHPPYPVQLRDRAARRAHRLQLFGYPDDFILGFLGDIKPYKGLDTLTKAPSCLANGRRVRIFISGQADRGYRETATAIISGLENVTWSQCRASDEDLDRIIQAVDVVFLPYTQISNSGFAQLVLSNHSRLLTSDLPLFRELQGQVGDAWIKCFSSDAASVAESLESSLSDMSSSSLSLDHEKRLISYLESISFDNTGRAFLIFYQQLLCFDGLT